MFLNFNKQLINVNHLVVVRQARNFIELTISTGETIEWGLDDTEAAEKELGHISRRLLAIKDKPE